MEEVHVGEVMPTADHEILTSIDDSTFTLLPTIYTNEGTMSPPNESQSNDDSDGQSDGESLKVQDITEEDAQSIFQVSISRAATHLTSARTPAAEKAAAFEDRPQGYFDVDSVLNLRPGGSTPPGVAEDSDPIDENDGWSNTLHVPGTKVHKSSLNLKKFSEPVAQDQDLPSTSHREPKSSSGSRSTESRSVLQEAFAPLKKRTMSGGSEALRKFLPKVLPSIPSMAKASSFMPSAPSFFSSSSQSKNSGRTMSLQNSESGRRIPEGGATRHKRSSTLCNMGGNEDSVRPSALRRVTSQDSSLLYHTPSSSSSLGDDSRWVNVSEQVNSRGKAIYDSLQDRTSFKLPTVNMPSMPNFNFNLNFSAYFNNATVDDRRNGTNTPKDILPSGKKPSSSPAPLNRRLEHDLSSHEADDALDRALSKMTGDIVVMGGYRGSILRSTKTRRQVWVPVKVGLNIRKVNLEVGLEPEDEEKMEESIYSSGMLQNIGPVDISKRLFKRLRDSPNAKNGTLRIHDYGYDWRLSPHLLSRQLITFLEGLQCNQSNVLPKERGAFLISHSLGGLITRHAINQRPELISGVVYAGVPHACVNILGPLRNGDAVLFSSRVLTAQVNFTLRTSFVLLPEDGVCFKDIKTGEEYPVDFFDPEEWIKYRWSPCTDPPLPPILPPPIGLTNLIMSSSLTNLPLIGNKKSSSNGNSKSNPTNMSPEQSMPSSPTTTTQAANILRDLDGGKDRTLAPINMSGSHHQSNSVAKTVTIPRPAAIAYLHRVLAETKQFKSELIFLPHHSQSNAYPPAAVIYGKETPTCSGAKVLGREGIPCADVYDNLSFGSGDGVVLAKEAMLPEGYHCVKGGRVASERGHVTLLGDLRAVGRAMEAVLRGRERGIGLGI